MKMSEAMRVLGMSPGSVADPDLTGITEDSRRVKPGFVFVAVRGAHVDGHTFIPDAAEKGAALISGDRTGIQETAGVPYVHVPEARWAAGVLAHAFAGDPSRSMRVIGITGTNGKTSAAVLIRAILEAAGKQAALFGTLGYDTGLESRNAPLTTPFAEDLAGLFREAADAGCAYAVMEVSSHALDQQRTAGIDFDAAGFTKLTQDHLDYHKDIEEYRRAKLRLFEGLQGPDRFAVVNLDDPHAEHFLKAAQVKTYTYGAKGDVRAASARQNGHGANYSIQTPWGRLDLTTSLLGRHNLSNILCAVAICGGLGTPLDAIAEGVASVEQVPGRFESIDEGQDFRVIVDYAHTEDGLRNVLAAARDICHGRVITVMGCGGDRDRTKRPRMGGAAGELSELTIITSDNPRTESPERIILDIETGMQKLDKRKGDDYFCIIDRAEAIREGICAAKPGDVVVIAGKGHEDYQILGTQRIHFDDREVARLVLQQRLAGHGCGA